MPVGHKWYCTGWMDNKVILISFRWWKVRKRISTSASAKNTGP